MGTMKTTVELPDALFRRAKAAAAQEGISLKSFFHDAISQRLRRRETPNRPWESGFGELRHLHAENRRIARLIEAEFETVDAEEWR